MGDECTNIAEEVICFVTRNQLVHNKSNQTSMELKLRPEEDFPL